jgi:DNA modification methylase
MAWQLYQGDALETLKQMEDESINCCVTSPPYWGLRDYGVEGQLGLEKTPEEYVSKMVEVFREVKRVLRKDGTLWLNLGDSYAGYWGDKKAREENRPSMADTNGWTNGFNMNARPDFHSAFDEMKIKPKDLVGIPWMVAFALRADGWWLRSDIIWAKGNPMPESVTDRPTKAHEYIFLLSKSARYFYDAEAIKEEAKEWTGQAATFKREGWKATQLHVPGQARVSHRPDRKQDQVHRRYTGFNDRYEQGPKRNKRTVWNINTKPFPEAHFAVFPPEIPEICIKAGCPEGGTVLDPFTGAGTTLFVAEQLGRNSIGIELNPEYCEIIRRRMAGLEMNLFQIQ